MNKVFQRSILSRNCTSEVSFALQGVLIPLIDLSLLAKQLHWTVVGPQFKPAHEQLDEVVDLAREASDEVAERLSTLGVAPDGRTGSVSSQSQLTQPKLDFTSAAETVTNVANVLHQVIMLVRNAIEAVGQHDPVSEDLLIGIASRLEKKLWMLQAQEV